jgi:hypothetical protein
VDDFLGIGGGALDDLVVRGREAPVDSILDFVMSRGGRLDSRRRNRFALEGLSLHASSGGTVNAPMGTVARFTNVPKWRLVAALDALAGAITIEGSLETKIEEWEGKRIMDWMERPTITVKPEFWAKEELVTIGQFEQLRSRVSDLERRADERDQRDAEDAIAGLVQLLADDGEAA